MDTLTKEVAVPLGVYMKGFPTLHRLHPFEQAMLELTWGTQTYERVLSKVDSLRKSVLQASAKTVQERQHCSLSSGVWSGKVHQAGPQQKPLIRQLLMLCCLRPCRHQTAWSQARHQVVPKLLPRL